jgi:predicted PurR-regulated permease PerM
MLGIDPRAARAAWTIFLFALALATIYLIRRTLMIFVIAMLVAYLLGPVVNLLERFVEKKLSRTASLALVYLVLVALVGTGVTVVGSKVAQEAVQLAKTLPNYLQNPQLVNEFPLPDALKPYREHIVEFIRQQWSSRSEEIVGTLTDAGRGMLEALSNIVFLILIPILSFFFLKDGEGIRQTILEQFKEGPGRRLVEDLMNDIHLVLVHFTRAMVLLSLCTFVIFSAVLSVLGVPFAVLLSALGASGEFIPAAGPVVTGLAILVVAGVAGYPHLIWLLVFLLVYRLFLDYALQPYLMGHGVELPPLAIIFGILAGEQVGGILGMFLSIPALATLRIIYVRSRKALDLVV